MKAEHLIKIIKVFLALLSLFSGILFFIGKNIPSVFLCLLFLIFCVLVLLLLLIWDAAQKKRMTDLSNDICETADSLIEGRELSNFHPYEESEASKIQAKLLQYYESMQEGQRQSQQDKQLIQELVSDISHQVKTPVANLKMLTGILQHHRLSLEKEKEFLDMMEAQVNKLDFLMQSLIKMSRLETGTFSMHMEDTELYHTVAQAVNSVWTKAEEKNIQIDADCPSHLKVKHDPKWTAEALGNILDNAIKYTPENGSVKISVKPWQFYTRIDITDTGIGIAKEHYNDIFQRFYRASEAASKEGVGLGLYLARGILSLQQGYVTVKSKVGKGSTFSVFLLN